MKNFIIGCLCFVLINGQHISTRNLVKTQIKDTDGGYKVVLYHWDGKKTRKNILDVVFADLEEARYFVHEYVWFGCGKKYEG